MQPWIASYEEEHRQWLPDSSAMLTTLLTEIIAFLCPVYRWKAMETQSCWIVILCCCLWLPLPSRHINPCRQNYHSGTWTSLTPILIIENFRIYRCWRHQSGNSVMICCSEMLKLGLCCQTGKPVNIYNHFNILLTQRSENWLRISLRGFYRPQLAGDGDILNHISKVHFKNCY